MIVGILSDGQSLQITEGGTQPSAGEVAWTRLQLWPKLEGTSKIQKGTEKETNLLEEKCPVTATHCGRHAVKCKRRGWWLAKAESGRPKRICIAGDSYPQNAQMQIAWQSEPLASAANQSIHAMVTM